MTRTIALRAGALFIVLAILSAIVGLGSQAAVAQALFLISAALCTLMLFYAVATPNHAAVPVRIRRYPARR